MFGPMPVRGRPPFFFSPVAIDSPLGYWYRKPSQSGIAPAGPPTVRIGETMAVAELNVSRRALLGAAFALPLGRHPGLDPGSIFLPSAAAIPGWIPDQVRDDERGSPGDEGGERRAENWRNALARLRRAEARLKALAHEPDEDLYDNVNAVFFHALKKLVRTPAPDLLALALKIDLAVDHEVAELTGGTACLAALKRDAARLCLSA